MSPKEQGTVNFYEYTQLGYYRDRNSPPDKNVGLINILEDIHSWFHNNDLSLQDTLLYNINDERFKNRTPIYLADIYHDKGTNDYILSFLRGSNSENKVRGIKRDSKLLKIGKNDIVTPKAGMLQQDDYIWGNFCYYWFIPDKKIYASIKFPSTDTDQIGIEKFIKDYMDIVSGLFKKTELCKTHAITDRTKLKERFKIKGKTYKRPFKKSDIKASEITHMLEKKINIRMA